MRRFDATGSRDGQQYAQQINPQLPIVPIPRSTATSTSSATRSPSSPTSRDLDWRFYVVDSREVNAFAVPGGFIYVNRGLIERAQNLSMLAGVLGHEIGHVTSGTLAADAEGARRERRRDAGLHPDARLRGPGAGA